jgi:T5SS/PEP-CTERM-associated repeat protein
VGNVGSSNQLVIQSGGVVSNSWNGNGIIGNQAGANSNRVLVTGAGSFWNNGGDLNIGFYSSTNLLAVQSGGVVSNAIGYIGRSAGAVRNSAIVSGNGSVWNNASSLYVGYSASNNQLTVTDSGTVRATNAVIGFNAGVTGNQITVSGGNFIVTNSAGGGALDVRRGTLTLDSGTVTADRFYATNGASSVVSFNGGTLRSSGTTVSNNTQFIVGDGVQSATFDLLGGTHNFANGLLLSSNATLIGNGTMFGAATNFGGISPGHSTGLLIFNDDLTLADSSVLDMEIEGPGTNDHVDITGLLTAGGWLNVSFINGYAPTNGAVFDLFDFGASSGVFSQTNLPTYAGTRWDTSHLYAPASDPLSGSIIFIPEPSSGLLLALGVGALATRRGKRGRMLAA